MENEEETKFSWTIVIIPVEIWVRGKVLPVFKKSGWKWASEASFQFRSHFLMTCELYSRDLLCLLPKPKILSFYLWNVNIFTFKGTLLVICGLCTAIVIQLPFVSMELLSNKFEVQWSPFLLFWQEHTDADHLLQLSRSNQPNCRLWQKWSTEIGARHKFRK